MKEMVGGCCVCSEELGWPENPLVYCDGQSCNVAVHQACYGIVQVPTGPWYCRKCETMERSARVRCELCPQKDGAFKKTDNGGWAHVVCALYIPEIEFGDVSTMEPIIISYIPQDRFNKSCYICEEKGEGSKATGGACMHCNKPGCKIYFHVTCAQTNGLLCEEPGNYQGNVQYCGYCSFHYRKLKKEGVKSIPAFEPIPAKNVTTSNTPEKPLKSCNEIRVIKEEQNFVNSMAVTSIPSTAITTSLTPNTFSKPDVHAAAVNHFIEARNDPKSSNTYNSSTVLENSLENANNTGNDLTFPMAKPEIFGEHRAKDSAINSSEIPSGNLDRNITGSSSSLADKGEGTKMAPPLVEECTNFVNVPDHCAAVEQASPAVPVTKQQTQGVKRSSPPGGANKPESQKKRTKKANIGGSPNQVKKCQKSQQGNPVTKKRSSKKKSEPTNQIVASEATASNSTPLFGLSPPSQQYKHAAGGDAASSNAMPGSMEELLERQWEQGSQFLMEQGKHFDIASLLGCLHQLRQENRRLEDHISTLMSRRDQLLAVNARLALPLSVTAQAVRGTTAVGGAVDGPPGCGGSTAGSASSHVSRVNHVLPPIETGTAKEPQRLNNSFSPSGSLNKSNKFPESHTSPRPQAQGVSAPSINQTRPSSGSSPRPDKSKKNITGSDLNTENARQVTNQSPVRSESGGSSSTNHKSVKKRRTPTPKASSHTSRPSSTPGVASYTNSVQRPASSTPGVASYTNSVQRLTLDARQLLMLQQQQQMMMASQLTHEQQVLLHQMLKHQQMTAAVQHTAATLPLYLPPSALQQQLPIATSSNSNLSSSSGSTSTSKEKTNQGTA